jgi:4-hydroxy-4-methyl-2-oxoglutarate aldolase
LTDSVIYTQIPKASICVEEALEFGVADLHEAMGAVGGRRMLMDPSMRALNVGLRIAGAAVTAFNYPGDNLLVHKALQLAQPGQVVVLSNGGGSQGALWGELMGTYAQKKGLAGVIVAGPIRDTDALREMRLPIWSTSISPSHPEKRGPGSVNVPIVCAGITVCPGDIIVADSDGVIAIPPHEFAATVARARQRVEKEARIIAGINEGKSLYELSHIEPLIQSAGIEIRDMTWQEDQQRGAHP